MKLTAQFVAKENKLFTLDGKEYVSAIKTLSAKSLIAENALPELSEGELLCLSLSWADVGKDEDSYDEAFLASLRDFLKALEEKKQFAFIKPEEPEGELTSSEKEAFVASMKHCARRIKDAASVVGFAVPKAVDSSFFMEELSAKHGHYIYFSSDDSLLSDSAIVRI